MVIRRELARDRVNDFSFFTRAYAIFLVFLVNRPVCRPGLPPNELLSSSRTEISRHAIRTAALTARYYSRFAKAPGKRTTVDRSFRERIGYGTFVDASDENSRTVKNVGPRCSISGNRTRGVPHDEKRERERKKSGKSRSRCQGDRKVAETSVEKSDSSGKRVWTTSVSVSGIERSRGSWYFLADLGT